MFNMLKKIIVISFIIEMNAHAMEENVNFSSSYPAESQRMEKTGDLPIPVAESIERVKMLTSRIAGSRHHAHYLAQINGNYEEILSNFIPTYAYNPPYYSIVNWRLLGKCLKSAPWVFSVIAPYQYTRHFNASNPLNNVESKDFNSLIRELAQPLKQSESKAFYVDIGNTFHVFVIERIGIDDMIIYQSFAFNYTLEKQLEEKSFKKHWKVRDFIKLLSQIMEFDQWTEEHDRIFLNLFGAKNRNIKGKNKYYLNFVSTEPYQSDWWKNEPQLKNFKKLSQNNALFIKYDNHISRALTMPKLVYDISDYIDSKIADNNNFYDKPIALNASYFYDQIRELKDAEKNEMREWLEYFLGEGRGAFSITGWSDLSLEAYRSLIEIMPFDMLPNDALVSESDYKQKIFIDDLLRRADLDLMDPAIFFDREQEHQVIKLLRSVLWENSQSYPSHSRLVRDAVFHINSFIYNDVTILEPKWREDMQVRNAIYGLTLLWSNLLAYSEKHGKEAARNFLNKYPQFSRLIKKYFSFSGKDFDIKIKTKQVSSNNNSVKLEEAAALIHTIVRTMSSDKISAAELSEFNKLIKNNDDLNIGNVLFTIISIKNQNKIEQLLIIAEIKNILFSFDIYHKYKVLFGFMCDTIINDILGRPNYIWDGSLFVDTQWQSENIKFIDQIIEGNYYQPGTPFILDRQFIKTVAGIAWLFPSLKDNKIISDQLLKS
jgi:hypothetical protein